MDDPSDPPISGSSYIIICSGRTAVMAAKDPEAKITFVSLCAALLCSFLETKHAVAPGDFKEVSDLQHEMMDNMYKWNKTQAAEKCAEMFRLLDELEEKFD